MWQRCRCWMLLAISLGSYFTVSNGLAVMSVDLGSEFMKVAIVKPGVPMEIVLNKESRRKTPVVVSMRNGERLFSDPAMTTAVKYPKAAYVYMQDLLAKGLDNIVVKRYQQRFPYYDLAEDPDTKTVYFQHSDDEKFTPEELLAMVLEHAKDIAEKFAEQPVNDAVITVPPYFNQAERRAMLRAGEMAGLKILQIMNDNTAVALNYGVFRRKAFNATAVHYMFFDMGATTTSATIVAYQESKIKNKATGVTEKTPQLTIKGVGMDRNLGGLELQLRLRDHLAKLFNEQKKTDSDVTKNARAMGKLFKEAGRLKHVLSANTNQYAQVESLLDDQDFKAKVTREEFESMCEDVFRRVDRVVKDALKSSEVTMDEISEVILMGGSTRVPKIQEKLQKSIGREDLGKSINTDEAAALGAVYQAAHLSKGFKVKKFAIKEATIYPIQVEFERAKQTDGSEEPEKKMVTRTLFGRNNPYPQNKVMTFNKHTKDFGFEVNYGVLDYLTAEELESFGSMNLMKISLSGVEEAYGKHKDEAEPKGIKAHFKMENSGILELDKVEFVFEKQPAQGEEKAEEEKSTLEKIGNAFGSLFGSPSEPPADGGVEDEQETKATDDSQAEKTPTQDTEQQDKKPEEKVDDGDKEPTADKEEVEQTDTDGKEGEEKVPEDVPEETDKDSQEASSESEKEEDDSGSQESETAGETEEQQTDDSKEEEKQEEKSEEKEEKSEEKEEKSEEQEDEKKGDEEKKEEGKEKKKEKKDKKGKKDKKEADKDKKKDEKKEEKPKVTSIKEDIKSSVDVLDAKDPSKEAVRESKKKIKDLRKKDEEKAELEKAKNDLETFTIDAQDKLYQDDYIACSTEAEREEYTAKLSEASDWIYEQEEDAKKEVFINKLKELKKMTKKLWERVKQRQDRPMAIEALRGMVNYTEHFLVNMKNFTAEEVGEQPFTKVEYETLETLIKDTKEWNATIMEEQAKTPDTEAPKLLVEDVAMKVQALDRELKYLTNKAKTFKPKVKKEDKNATKTDANATKTETKEEVVKEKDEKEDIKTEEDSKPAEGSEEGDKADKGAEEGEGEEVKDAKEEGRQEEGEQGDATEENKEEEEILQLDAGEETSSTSDDQASEDTKEEEKSKSTDSKQKTTKDQETVTHDAQDL